MAHSLPFLIFALLLTACSSTEATTDSADSDGGQDPGLADGQVEIVDREPERRDVVCLGRGRADLDAFGFQVQFPCQSEQFDQGLAR